METGPVSPNILQKGPNEDVEVVGSQEQPEDPKTKSIVIIRKNIPNLLFATTLIVFSIVVGIVATIIFGLAGFSASTPSFVLYVPLGALALVLIFALVLKIVFKILLKRKINWVFATLSFVAAIAFAIVFIVFQFTKLHKETATFDEEYPVIIENLKKAFVLDSVNFLGDEAASTLKVEINYHFDNLPQKPVIEEGILHYFIEPGFDPKNLRDQRYYVGNCQPFDSGLIRTKEYASGRPIPIESDIPMSNASYYKTVVEYKIGDYKHGQFCEPERVYKNINGLIFYIKLDNGKMIVAEIPADLKISDPNPNQDLINLNNKVINAVRDEDLDTLYNLMSPSMKQMLTPQSFKDADNIIDNTQGKVVTLELIEEPAVVDLNNVEKGVWAQSVFRVKRQKQTKDYVVRYFKENDNWWLAGTLEK